MDNFTFHNPVKIVFGKGAIAQLPGLLPEQANILMTWGGGSIKRNGVHDQVMASLKGRKVVEFPGIEPNPQYSTLMRAREICRKENIGFLLAVGGGSVLDGTKFIAAAVEYRGQEPWDILEKGAKIEKALPLGAVLTLPATGSEMNGNSVISRAETEQKLGFGSGKVMPLFSILDPETTYSLPPRQTANGIVDAMVHVFEQYLTRETGSEVNEGIAETALRVTIRNGRSVFREPNNYEIRANLMWAATMALNGVIGAGAAHDWTSHMIGHELTAFYGLDHGQTLAVISPAVLRYKRDQKRAMLAKYARNVWEISEKDEAKAGEAAVARTVEFWNLIGVKTRLSDYGVGQDRFSEIAGRVCAGGKLGENEDIGPEDVVNILKSSL